MPIFSLTSEQSDKVVFGFVHELIGFDFSSDVIRLIRRFFSLMHNASGNCADLEWRFNNPSTVSLFKGCKKGDVLTSEQFMIGGCVLYLELTPCGWGPWDKEG